MPLHADCMGEFQLDHEQLKRGDVFGGGEAHKEVQKTVERPFYHAPPTPVRCRSLAASSM